MMQSHKLRQSFVYKVVSFLIFVVLASRFETDVAFGQSDDSHVPDRFNHLRHVVKANGLDLSGAAPFHLKLSFQLYDLTGQPEDKGTIEMWWAGAGHRKILVRSPSYQLSEDSEHTETLDRNREGYLVDQLLSTVTHPVQADFVNAPYVPTEVAYDNETKSITCIVKRPASAPDVTTEMSRYCIDPLNDVLMRQTGEGDLIIKRDVPSLFHDVNVCSSVSISYLGRPAITGNIELLEDMAIERTGAETERKTVGDSRIIDSSYIVGLRLSAKNPTYPKLARAAHITGSVTLGAIITKEGTIRDLDVIATPNPLLSKSATDAVQTWTYKPYLLNGSPTEVLTSIYVKFAIGR